MSAKRAAAGSFLILALSFVFAFVFSSHPASSSAVDRSEVWGLFREGELAFRQANELLKTDPSKARDLYQRAALCFDRIQREGGIENGKLYYNIGNIYFRLGDLGKAILNYRRAERLMPNDLNLQQNMDYARSRCIDRIEVRPQDKVFAILFFWHYDLDTRARTALLLIFFNLIWICATLYLFRKNKGLRFGIAACALVSVILTGSLAVGAFQESHSRSGVVLSPEVVARKGDSSTYEPSFKEPLHAGTEFSLVEERLGWYHIQLADGRQCWIPDIAAGII